MPDGTRQPPPRAIERMVRQRTAQERFPVLDLVLENLARGMWAAVRRLLGEDAEVGWESSSVGRFDDYCEAAAPGSVFGVFRIAEWETQGLLTLDADLVEAAVEALLGGGQVLSAPPGPRQPTVVDRAIAGRFIRLAIDELARAFARADQSLGPLTAKLIRLEDDPRLLALPRRDEIVIDAGFKVVLGPGARGGRFDLLLPHAVLEPARRKFLNARRPPRQPVEEPAAGPLLAVLPDTPLTLHAVVDRLTLSLAEIARWRKGTVLPLGVDADRPAILYGEKEGGPGLGRRMFVGRLGASQGRKAVRILGILSAPADGRGTRS